MNPAYMNIIIVKKTIILKIKADQDPPRQDLCSF